MLRRPAEVGERAALIAGSAVVMRQLHGEFVLPYEAVRTSPDPEATLMAFLDSTFEAAARLGDWDRSLECMRGLKGKPHAID